MAISYELRVKLKFQILYQFFLESNYENDNFVYTQVNLKKNELHHNVNFLIKKKLRINHKAIWKWKRTFWRGAVSWSSAIWCIILAEPILHQIAELQLTAPLQKSATKFYNRPRYFFQIRSKISKWRLQQVLCPCVVVEKPLEVYNSSNRA